MNALSTLCANVREWVGGRSWLVRIPVLLLFGAIFKHWCADPSSSSIFWGLNLGLHELGHLLFRPLGEWWSVAGGSLTQCAAPLCSFIVFCRQRDYFALSFSFGWLATNLFETANYIADARAMVMPLVSPFGGEVWHDWNYLLSRAGWLAWDHALAGWVRAAGAVSMVVGLAYGAWVLWEMAASHAHINPSEMK